MKVKFLSAKMKAISAAVAFALSVGFISPTAEAGLQSSMESIFNSMTNVSKPGVYESVSRGVLSGGELSIHNRIVSANVISIAPPSWKVGCGGIDFFGGSFSMINADQLIQVMRAIPANAAGYAFSLAIGYISEKIGDEIKDFLRQIQDWVRKFSNSCEMAKSMVDFGRSTEVWQSLKRSFEGITTASGKTQDTAQSAQDNNMMQAADTPEGKRLLGNIVYRAIMEQDAAKWEANKTGSSTEDDYFAEEMMSLFGTVIVTAKKTDGKVATGSEAAADKENHTYDVEVKGPVLNIKDVFNGGSQAIYRCTGKGAKTDYDSYCTEMSYSKDSTIELPELRYKIMEVLLGKDYRLQNKIEGAIMKHVDPVTYGNTTTVEQFLISNLPEEVSQPMLKLARWSPRAAATFIRMSISSITVEFLNHMVRQFAKVVHDAVNATKGGQSVSQTLKEIDFNELKLLKDVDDLRSTYGDVADILRNYNYINQTLPNNNLNTSGGIAADANRPVAEALPIKIH